MSKQLEITREPSLCNLGQNPHFEAWRPPPPGAVKINFDAALDAQQGYVGVGIIARDHMSLFMGARSIVYKVKMQAKIAESMAALGAVLFRKEARFLDAIFEGDAKQVVLEINLDPLSL
jgi:ribonuclease HI